jgi:hypothetical protein
MASGASWTNLFGGDSPIAPANPSYFALTIAQPTSLVWPLETTGGAPHLASQIDVTGLTLNLTLAMPPGGTGSNGAQSMITNIGSVDIITTDSFGIPITTIKPGISWLITLTDNTTENGTWRAYQLAATTSSANAGALAGSGLQAVGTTLQTVWLTQTVAINTPLTVAQRATLMVWTGAVGTLQLTAKATLTAGWYCAVTNEGTGTVTISTSAGDTINGRGSLVMNPGNSGIIVCGPAGFNTCGALITTLPIASGGTGATTAFDARVNLGASPIGAAIFTAPNAATINALLGTQNNLAVGDMKETALHEDLLPALLPGWHICDGRARPRTDPLWARTGQVNPAYWPFGNGDNSTTYNLPDLRGRVPLGRDNMGGTAANRVTAAVSGINATAVGAQGGNQALTSHSHGITDVNHAHGIADVGHGHGLNDAGHSHGVNDPGHFHPLADPGHGHGVSDPGHGHTVVDPGHTHSLDRDVMSEGLVNNRNTSFAGGFGQGAVNANSSGTGIGIAGNGTGIGIQLSGTGITLGSGTTVISIQDGATGMSVQAGVAGVAVLNAGTGLTTTNAAGGGASANMPPVLVVSMVIYVGA